MQKDISAWMFLLSLLPLTLVLCKISVVWLSMVRLLSDRFLAERIYFCWNLIWCSWLFLLFTAGILAISFLLCVFSLSDFRYEDFHSQLLFVKNFAERLFAVGRFILTVFVTNQFALVLSVGEVFVAGLFIKKFFCTSKFCNQIVSEQIFTIRLFIDRISSCIFFVRLLNARLWRSFCYFLSVVGQLLADRFL